jgi:hypothetical protein
MMSDVALQELLADAMARHRCPVCAVLDSMVFDELCRLQREAVVDPDTHADVVARGGYCADHFWYLDALASPVTNAELLAPLIDTASERLAQLVADVPGNPGVLRHGTAQLATRLGIPASCRICDRIATWQATAIETLLAIIREPQRAEAYAHSGGLCLPHLVGALSTGVDRALADYLLQVALDQSRRLAADLRLYVRKWKDKDRRWGPENAAARRAIEKLVGTNPQRTRSG